MSLVWLITGCSSGFGEEFVQQVLRRGDLVIATARRLSSIAHLEQPGVLCLELDVTENQKMHDETVAKAIGAFGKVDVVIHNAGYGTMGPLEQIDHEVWITQFETNVFGVARLTRAILPYFRQRRTGTFIFMSSLAGWNGNPLASPYNSSKFALEGLAEALNGEVTHLGIKTLLVEPGHFRTNLLASGHMQKIDSNITEYSQMISAFATAMKQVSGHQPGNIEKGVSVVIDLVKGEGVAQGKETPSRMPLGVDAFDGIKAKCEQTLKLLIEWESIIKDTNYDD